MNQNEINLFSSARWVAGVDEAGRGPLAGPVYAAAVILDPERPIQGLNDSKKLTARKRQDLEPLIKERVTSWAVASASVEEIDQINILQATFLAMKRAVEALDQQPEHVFIDGNRCPKLDCTVEPVVKGDQLIPAISAASILAKEARDREMRQWAERFPLYGFDQHMGYGTKQHLSALHDHGCTLIHRKSFEPIKSMVEVLE